MITKIQNGTVVSDGKSIKAHVYIEDDKIKAVTTENLPYDEKIDASGLYVSAGFVDIHTHGAAGYDFLDNTKEAFVQIAKEQAKHGATTIIPTVTSSTKEGTLGAIQVFESLKGEMYNGANMPGLHLEGPYFAMSQKGAQDPRFIRDFDKDEYEEILSHKGAVVRWTGAPELCGSEEFARCLRRNGVLPCIGHSDADSVQTKKALDCGFTHVTHLYSCTSIVHRKNAFRYAGIVEAAYLYDDMTVEIIADGIHLPGDLLKLVYKIKGARKIALVTDSMRGAGMPDGESILGGLKDGLHVIIEDGVAKLPDRSAFAGSVASFDRLVRNMVQMADVSLEDACLMASTTPCNIVGLKNKGLVKAGYDGDIAIFDKNIDVKYTIVGGRIVYQNA